MKIICDICGKECNGKNGLNSHRRWHNPEFREMVREKISKGMLGHKLSESTKKKISEKNKANNSGFKKGYTPWNKGLTKKTDIRIKEMSIKIGMSHIGGWKENLGYGGLHYRIRQNKPLSEICEICGEKKDEYGNTKLELSNISGEYKKDLNDWQWVHHSCHMIHDHKYKIYRPPEMINT